MSVSFSVEGFSFPSCCEAFSKYEPCSCAPVHPSPDEYVNFSNANAFSLLRLLGLDGEWGCIEVEDFSEVLRKLMRVINSEAHRASEVESAEVSESFFYGGRSDESIVRRAESLRDLILNAQRSGKRVTWG